MESTNVPVGITYTVTSATSKSSINLCETRKLEIKFTFRGLAFVIKECAAQQDVNHKIHNLKINEGSRGMQQMMKQYEQAAQHSIFCSLNLII